VRQSATYWRWLPHYSDGRLPAQLNPASDKLATASSRRAHVPASMMKATHTVSAERAGHRCARMRLAGITFHFIAQASEGMPRQIRGEELQSGIREGKIIFVAVMDATARNACRRPGRWRKANAEETDSGRRRRARSRATSRYLFFFGAFRAGLAFLALFAFFLAIHAPLEKDTARLRAQLNHTQENPRVQ